MTEKMSDREAQAIKASGNLLSRAFEPTSGEDAGAYVPPKGVRFVSETEKRAISSAGRYLERAFEPDRTKKS